jgi:hypothetical protein
MFDYGFSNMKKPFERAKLMQKGRLLLAGVEWHLIDLPRRDNHSSHGLVCFECAAAINILALVITFFCFF